MSAMDLRVLVSMGLLAGAVTTLAGLGGGLLIVVLALWLGPHAALAVSAPALLLGHLHRVWLLRRELDRRVLWPFALGIAPLAYVGSLLFVRLDATTLRWVLVAALVIAVLDVAGALDVRAERGRRVSPRWLLAGGGGVGLMMATGGGAGLLAAPVLRSAGLRGDAMVVTLAAGAVVGHLARTLAYGRAELLDRTSLGAAALLALALMAGNLLGRWLSGRVGEQARERMLHGVVLLGLALALVQAVA